MIAFSTAVEIVFADFLKAHGYVVARRTSRKVAFDSKSQSITFSYGNRGSSEISVELRTHQNDYGPDFSFGEMLEAMRTPARERPQGYAVSGVASARRLLQRISSLMEKYCIDLLDGEPNAWSQLVKCRELAAARYANQNQVQQALAEANPAWQLREWKKVVQLLTPVQQWLGDADRAKLDYANRRLKPH